MIRRRRPKVRLRQRLKNGALEAAESALERSLAWLWQGWDDRRTCVRPKGFQGSGLENGLRLPREHKGIYRHGWIGRYCLNLHRYPVTRDCLILCGYAQTDAGGLSEIWRTASRILLTSQLCHSGMLSTTCSTTRSATT